MNLLNNPINKITAELIVLSNDYKALPKVQSKAINSYKSLWIKLYNRAKEIEKQMEVTYSNNDFYKNSKEMFADVQNNNHIFIFKGGERHPVWGHKYNRAFRLVHDIDGHNCECAFNLDGEKKTVQNMFTKLSLNEEEKNILFTEIVGQFAYVLVENKGREYAPQKCGILNRKEYNI